ncbi:hypothetical protein CEXT_269271 [Caerostris extrusa]|uniref:Uncharacterized protein n=1 Tax=Caerostris extrusa TaxID=172846 RepID=A0AAV4MYA9_CAEEX|nr:hypothetical protein CEXT_269271 [Caerostris extrusa]
MAGSCDANIFSSAKDAISGIRSDNRDFISPRVNSWTWENRCLLPRSGLAIKFKKRFLKNTLNLQFFCLLGILWASPLGWREDQELREIFTVR